MLQRFDGAHRSSGELGHRFEREIRDEAQHDDLALVGRKRTESIDEAGIEWLTRCLGNGKRIGVQEAPTLRETSTFIDEAVVGDREHPPA